MIRVMPLVVFVLAAMLTELSTVIRVNGYVRVVVILVGDEWHHSVSSRSV